MPWPRRATIALLLSIAGCVPGDPEGPPGPLFTPAEATLHRLTRPKLQQAWLALLGEPLIMPGRLPADDTLYGFSSISAARAAISPSDAEKYAAATYHVLDQVWSDPARRDRLIGCPSPEADEPCLRTFTSTFAARAWRRPVSQEEIDALVALALDVAGDAGPDQGAKSVAAAALLSPDFLFRIDIGEPSLAGYRYTGLEMASRLSFLLTDSPPDEPLQEAAARGDLLTTDGIRAQARRLLDDPRARPALGGFFRDHMNLPALDTINKLLPSGLTLPATAGKSMRIELERMFEANVFDREADYRDLLLTRDTAMNQDLARIYGVSGIVDQTFIPVTLPDDGERAGLLTTPGFLALNAHRTQTSPTRRGRFIRWNLLCEDIPPPPPGMDTSLPDIDPTKPLPLRDRLALHRKDPACAACHDRMDPIGFAFEAFDMTGAHRTEDENGLPVDTASDIDGTPISGAADVAALLAASPRVAACIARRLYEHGAAHPAGPADEPIINELAAEFSARGHVFKELILAFVTSDAFRKAKPPSTAKEAP